MNNGHKIAFSFSLGVLTTIITLIALDNHKYRCKKQKQPQIEVITIDDKSDTTYIYKFE